MPPALTKPSRGRDGYSCLLQAEYESDYEYDQKKIGGYNTSTIICQKKVGEYDYEYILDC